MKRKREGGLVRSREFGRREEERKQVCFETPDGQKTTRDTRNEAELDEDGGVYITSRERRGRRRLTKKESIDSFV